MTEQARCLMTADRCLFNIRFKMSKKHREHIPWLICQDHQPRFDATHCYTAEEFGEACAVCERHPMAWRECNQFTWPSYQAKRVLERPCNDKLFDYWQWPSPAYEHVWVDGMNVGRRLRLPYGTKEYWPDIPNATDQPSANRSSRAGSLSAHRLR